MLSKNAADDWDLLLKSKRGLRHYIAKLYEKALSNRQLIFSNGLVPSLSLRSVFFHEDVYTDIVSKFLNQKPENMHLSAQRMSTVFTDKERTFFVADWPERILLSRMAEILSNEINLRLSSHVYSFQKGKGPHQAVSDLAAYVRKHGARGLFILKRDVASYGDCITYSRTHNLLLEFKGYADSPVFQKLLFESFHIGFSADNAEVATQCLSYGVPAGSPLTPPIENLYLMQLDSALDSTPDSFYGRYGDDFIFASCSAEVAYRASLKIDAVIRSLNLMVKESKTENIAMSSHTSGFWKKSCRIEWLGQSVNIAGQVGPKRDHSRRARRQLQRQIESLFMRCAAFSLDQSSQGHVLRNGLYEILSRNNPPVQSLLQKNEVRESIQALDKHLHHLIVRRLVANLNLTRNGAWGLLRSFHLPTLSSIKDNSHHTRVKASSKRVA